MTIVLLGMVYVLWEPAASNRLAQLLINCIPSAMVALVAIPAVYFLFTKHGIVTQPHLDERQMADAIGKQLLADTHKEDPDTHFVTWSQFLAAVQELQDHILADTSFKPDVVVSVGRSGAILGGLLAGNLGGLKHYGIDRIHTQIEGKRLTKIVPPCSGLQSVLSGKNVVVVMAECIAGDTLQLARDEIKSSVKDLCHIKSAALFRSENATFRPDYHARPYTGRRLVFRSDSWIRDSMHPTQQADEATK